MPDVSNFQIFMVGVASGSLAVAAIAQMVSAYQGFRFSSRRRKRLVDQRMAFCNRVMSGVRCDNEIAIINAAADAQEFIAIEYNNLLIADRGDRDGDCNNGQEQGDARQSVRLFRRCRLRLRCYRLAVREFMLLARPMLRQCLAILLLRDLLFTENGARYLSFPSVTSAVDDALKRENIH